MNGSATMAVENSDKAAAVEKVSVIIPCYNHARFLAEAIASVCSQTYPCVEIIVIDDGSIDATKQVAGRFAQVRYIRQTNQGLAAARNTGIQASSGDYLVFLDADDRLMPAALVHGAQCLRQHPDCAFVYGAYRWIDGQGNYISDGWAASLIVTDHYAEMLRRNFIVMHASVMYRRAALTDIGGFNPQLAACEDYDLYLRLARLHPVTCHDHVVAEYRMHDSNMSGDPALMLRTSLQVLRTQYRHVRHDASLMQAYRAGRIFWQRCYGEELVKQATGPYKVNIMSTFHNKGVLLRYAPGWFLKYTASRFMKYLRRTLKVLVPRSVRRKLQVLRGKARSHPAIGQVRMGDLRRVTPLSRQFGYDRGLPIDRYYIEGFLARYAHHVQGNVLEIKDATYTRRYGNGRVIQSEVLDIDKTNPAATIVADLNQSYHVPLEHFDCIILTQTLHLIYDIRSALDTLYNMLKPGGVLLLTVPGITRVDLNSSWYWSFTERAIRQLLEEVFPVQDIVIETHGNVLAAQLFLQGLAVTELQPEELDWNDPEFPVTIAAQAVRPVYN